MSAIQTNTAASTSGPPAPEDPNNSAINAMLLTSNITMIIAVLILIGVFILGVWILAKIKHIPTTATVHDIVDKHIRTPHVNPKTAAPGGTSFW